MGLWRPSGEVVLWKADSMRKRYLWSIFLVLYVGSVSGNSLTLVMKSSARGMLVLQLVTGVMKAVGLESVGMTGHSIRRAAYFSEYTLLRIPLAQYLARYELLAVTRWQLRGLAGSLIPFVDEMLQPFIEGRSGQINDVRLDCARMLFGTVPLPAVGRWNRKGKGKKNVEKKL